MTNEVATQEQSQQRRCQISWLTKGKKRRCIPNIIIICAVAAIFLVVRSFSYMHYYEMGFLRSITTGKVDTSTVYTTGRYFLGIAQNFKKFPKVAHFENFKTLSIFNKEKLEVTMECSLQYYIYPYELADLHSAYDKAYRPVLRSTLVTALKSEATKYTVDEFRLERPKIAKALENAARLILGGPCAKNYTSRTSCSKAQRGQFSELRYFQLGLVSITDEQKKRFLTQVIENEKKDTEAFKQKESITRAETRRLKRIIENEAAELSQNASAKAALIKKRADIDAKALIEDARNSGLEILFNTLNVTKFEHKKSFDYLRTLRDHNGASMYLGFQSLIGKP